MRAGIQRLIAIGLLANTCLESTVRFAAGLGYDATVARDATASFTPDQMHASLDINLPNDASAVVATRALLESLSAS